MRDRQRQTDSDDKNLLNENLSKKMPLYGVLQATGD